MGGKKKKGRYIKVHPAGYTDDLSLTGAFLCIIGGMLLALSTLLSWVTSNGNGLSVFDMIESNQLFFLLLKGELLGIVCIGLSIVIFNRPKWPKERKRRWAIVLLALNVIIAACLIISFSITELDYVGKSAHYAYGMGPFIVIFAVLFSFVGAMLVLSAAGATSQLAVQPTPSKASRTLDERKAPAPKQTPQVFDGRHCPTCGEDVDDAQAICPNCLTVLRAGPKKKKEEPDDDELDQVE